MLILLFLCAVYSVTGQGPLPYPPPEYGPYGGPYGGPPRGPPYQGIEPDEMGCVRSPSPLADCYGADFVPTPAMEEFRPQGCVTHEDCYSLREPPFWCRLAPNQQWSKEGSHCDPKLHICVVDRITHTPQGPFWEYTYAFPSAFYRCQW